MKRIVILFFLFYILSSLSIDYPTKKLPVNEKITVWPEFSNTDYRQGKINLNPFFQISIYGSDAQDYFRMRKPLFLSDGTNKIPVIYQEVFEITSLCTQVLLRPKITLKKNQMYKLEYMQDLNLPELKWTTIDIDFYDYTRPLFQKHTSYMDTSLNEYKLNGLYVDASDESNCGGVLELYLTPNKIFKILLTSNFEIPPLIVNQLPIGEAESVFDYKLTLIDESGNLSLKSMFGKISLKKLFEEHIHESQARCCSIPKGYEIPESNSFFQDFIMLTNPVLSIFLVIILVYILLFIISYSTQQIDKKKKNKELRQEIDGDNDKNQ